MHLLKQGLQKLADEVQVGCGSFGQIHGFRQQFNLVVRSRSLQSVILIYFTFYRRSNGRKYRAGTEYAVH